MSDYGGYLFILDEAERASRIEMYISSKGTFTDTISAADWRTKYAEIFLVSLDGGSIHYAALAHRGKTVATEKHQIRLTHFVEFSPPVPLEQIQSRLAQRLHPFFIRSSSGMGTRVTPKTWQNLISVIKQLRPRSAASLEQLEELRRLSPAFFRRPGSEVLAEERDAVNLALRMSGFDQSEILSWVPSEGEQLAPFLQDLEQAKISEDQMIAHDAEVFGDWERLRRYQVGAAVFRKGNERLTVMNVNRHSLEHTLGVDLFYYQHRYDSYVMIQYKRMVKEEGEALYRPIDKSYRAELQRMREFERMIAEIEDPSATALRNYRLHPGIFYFKLCPSEVLDVTSTEMIKGMYIPLDYWELLMNSPDILGPKGGRQVTYENVGRYFNNTLFIEMVKLGLIGSRLISTEALSEITQKSIEEGRSVILASMHFAKQTDET